MTTKTKLNAQQLLKAQQQAELRKVRRDQFKLQVSELRKVQTGKLLTLLEVVALTSYSIPSIYRFQKCGQFPHSIRCGRAVRWSEPEINAWIQYRMTKQYAELAAEK